MLHTVDRCPECRAIDAVIVDPPRDCDHCERGGQLEKVPIILAEVTDEMVERAARRACEFLSTDNWDELPDQDTDPRDKRLYRFDYRGLAEALLTVAFQDKHEPQEG